jgi:hypothetical protein
VELGTPAAPGARVHVVARPEALSFAAQGLAGKVVERRYTGARAFFRVEANGAVLEVEAPADSATVGSDVKVAASRTRAFPL